VQDTTIPYFDSSRIAVYICHNQISNNFLIFLATDTTRNNLIFCGKKPVKNKPNASPQ
jgi:hypothetical protein